MFCEVAHNVHALLGFELLLGAFDMISRNRIRIFSASEIADDAGADDFEAVCAWIDRNS